MRPSSASLSDISRQWLERKKSHEMTFDMGSFSLDDIRQYGAAVAIRFLGPRPGLCDLASLRAGDRPGARPDAVAPQGEGDATSWILSLVESIYHFRSLGIHDISLGNAPLANTEKESVSLQAEGKAVQFLFENLIAFMAIIAFRIQTQYRPQWRGRYVAYHRGVHLPLVRPGAGSGACAGRNLEVFVR